MSGCRRGLSPGTEQGGGGEAGAAFSRSSLPTVGARGAGSARGELTVGFIQAHAITLRRFCFLFFVFFSKRRHPR